MGDAARTQDLLAREYGAVDAALAALERRRAAGEALPLADTVEQAIALTRRLIVATIAAAGTKAPPPPEADLLEAFKVLVKGEPSWTAIRDNCRELVYYRNCLALGRRDALPAAPEAMALRTARHVCLYIRTRCLREGWLPD
jgi:hypothetical protein